MAEVSYERLQSLDVFNHLPVLTLDERWYKLMPEQEKTDEIRYWERKVNELLQKQGQVSSNLEDVKQLKAKLLEGILANMEKDDDPEHYRKLMDKSQRLVFETKEKIATLEQESQDIPQKLLKANQRLMIETVKVCYTTMKQNTQDIEKLDEWIDQTRVMLKKRLLVKQDKEEINHQMYSGLHGILGRDLMGEIDKINEH